MCRTATLSHHSTVVYRCRQRTRFESYLETRLLRGLSTYRNFTRNWNHVETLVAELLGSIYIQLANTLLRMRCKTQSGRGDNTAVLEDKVSMPDWNIGMCDTLSEGQTNKHVMYRKTSFLRREFKDLAIPSLALVLVGSYWPNAQEWMLFVIPTF